MRSFGYQLDIDKPNFLSIMGAYLPDLPRSYNSRSAEVAKSRTRKLVEKSGDKGSKKATTASDASGGKSASQKSQPSGGKVKEKSQATRTGKTPFEVSTSQKTSYYVDVEKTRRLGYLVLSSSLGSATIKTLKMIRERLQDQNCSGTSASD
jgi:hypothetical protein